MTHEMLFQTLTFHPGLNITVRSGAAWHEKVKPGDTLLMRLSDKTRPDSELGRVLYSAVVNFAEFPEEWLRFEHAPGARSMAGLESAMKAAYGENFGPEVSVLFFWV